MPSLKVNVRTGETSPIILYSTSSSAKAFDATRDVSEKATIALSAKKLVKFLQVIKF